MSSSIVDEFRSQTNGAADGTGMMILIDRAKARFGNDIPLELVEYIGGVQLSSFGDVPTNKDLAPSGIFLAIFVIFMFGHLYIFIRNRMRGHNFYLSLFFALYCLMRWVGFALRIVWAKDNFNVPVGLASSVFLAISAVLLAGLNLMLAQRIFTWRHPHMGSTGLFWFNMIQTYVIVLGVVAMGIVGSNIPNIYFLGKHHLHMCQQANQAAGVLNIYFSGLAGVLTIAAFTVPSSKHDYEVFTYQPWWVESFSIWYFVPKGAANRAAESFKQRDSSAFDAKRIIASTHVNHSNRIERCISKNDDATLTHNHSIQIITLTTIILLISSSFRAASIFITDHKSDQSWIFQPVVMYVTFGVLETFINILYLTGRVDLRFYRPDRLKAHHRGIISELSKSGTTEDTYLQQKPTNGESINSTTGDFISEKPETSHHENHSSDNIV